MTELVLDGVQHRQQRAGPVAVLFDQRFEPLVGGR
jgi:hypothetical protein